MASIADLDLLSFVGYEGGGGLELIFASSAGFGRYSFLVMVRFNHDRRYHCRYL